MHIGFQLSQMAVSQPPPAAGQGTGWRNRLRSHGQSCRPDKVPGFALIEERATKCQQLKYQIPLRKHGFSRLRSLCQPELRSEAIVQSSGTPEPSSNYQQSIPDHNATSASQDQSLFGRWIADVATFAQNHVSPNIKDLIDIPAKLHYPTIPELGWKSGIVLVTMVVLTIVVCTLDATYAAAMSWYMQRCLWLSSVCTTRRVLAAVYCMTMLGTMRSVCIN